MAANFQEQSQLRQSYTKSASPNHQCDITVSVCSATDYIYHDVDLRAAVEWFKTLLVMCQIFLIKSMFI